MGTNCGPLVADLYDKQAMLLMRLTLLPDTCIWTIFLILIMFILTIW